jgi:hypothetical protein
MCSSFEKRESGGRKQEISFSKMDHPHCEFDLQITPKAAKKCANSGNSAFA